ncbi:MAG: DUF4387 family protein [Pseudomonadota bacterium]
MATLGEVVTKVRSKNAGPFWLTIDVFCGSSGAFDQVRDALSTERVASLYRQPAESIKRFEIPTLNVIKFSMPRPTIQGSREDRDMHGSQWGWLLAELEIN